MSKRMRRILIGVALGLSAVIAGSCFLLWLVTAPLEHEPEPTPVDGTPPPDVMQPK